MLHAAAAEMAISISGLIWPAVSWISGRFLPQEAHSPAAHWHSDRNNFIIVRNVTRQSHKILTMLWNAVVACHWKCYFFFIKSVVRKKALKQPNQSRKEGTITICCFPFFSCLTLATTPGRQLNCLEVKKKKTDDFLSISNNRNTHTHACMPRANVSICIFQQLACQSDNWPKLLRH